jgi:hypothetical protein
LANIKVQRCVIVRQECMQSIAERHPSVKQARVIGLFGCIDLQKNTRGLRQLICSRGTLRTPGDFLCRVNEASPHMAKFKTVSTAALCFAHDARRPSPSKACSR